MAEMNLPTKNGRRKVQPPRIDLTPMVDLGFLLITFFMFTTTLAQEKRLVINMPDAAVPDKPTVFPEESTLTLIPAAGHKLYYYEGTLNSNDELKSSSMNNVVHIVINKKKQVAALPAKYSAEAHKLHVLIKASDEARYDDLIKAIDALLINDVQIYTLADITPPEQEAIQAMK